MLPVWAFGELGRKTLAQPPSMESNFIAIRQPSPAGTSTGRTSGAPSPAPRPSSTDFAIRYCGRLPTIDSSIQPMSFWPGAVRASIPAMKATSSSASTASSVPSANCATRCPGNRFSTGFMSWRASGRTLSASHSSRAPGSRNSTPPTKVSLMNWAVFFMVVFLS